MVTIKYKLFEFSTVRRELDDLKIDTVEFKLGRKYHKLRNQFSLGKFPKDIQHEFNELIKGIGCCVCQMSDNLQRHHIKPLSHGGDNHPDNICIVCKECHEKIHGFSFKKTKKQKIKQIKPKLKPVEKRYRNPLNKNLRTKTCGHGNVRKWCTECRYGNPIQWRYR